MVAARAGRPRLTEALGVERVLEPPNALPQAAQRLDVIPPMRPYEIELDVEMLALDSTSFRQLAEANDHDPIRVGDAIKDIVAERGKMHNPVTGSGGVLTGTVRAVGDRYGDAPPIGTRVITLVSLTLTPLKLEKVGPVDLDTPHVPVKGTAYLPSSAKVLAYPEDIAFDAALAAVDVCNAATQTRALIDAGTKTVLVLGGGHAGLLALAAVRDTTAQAILIDTDERICQRARDLDLCHHALKLDLRDAVGSLKASENEGIPRADLTVVVVNAADCEAAAILLTADHGTVLFFSMATSFTKAALGSDGLASSARMLIGSGHAPDRGAYALELIRKDKRLQEALS